MTIEIYSQDDSTNLYAKSALIVKFSYFPQIPVLKLTLISDDIVHSLRGGDYSINGLWFDTRNPEELILTMTQRTLTGGNPSCWLYHLYTDDFMRLRKTEIVYDISNLPCYIPIILPY